ncbi:MAG: IMP dehydrogenase [Nanoarchaeota archaeon]|nr:IMP dehydrogenase [Nanoarchaeota archaeon]
MAGISKTTSDSLREYLILTGWICAKPEEVSLTSTLGPITLQYPYMISRMQCIVGPEIAVSAGREGILTMIPRSLRDEDKQKIIDENIKARLKKGDVEFIIDPVSAPPGSALEEIVNIVERIGHSVIPIMDRMSKLDGIYVHDPNKPLLTPPWTPVTEVMYRLSNEDSSNGIRYLVNCEDVGEIKRILSSGKRRFVPIVNENMILQKLAFLQKYDTNFIGIAVSTRGDWKKELETWGPQVDTLCIDSSNACFDDALEILKYAKESREFRDKPFGIGNIIRGKHFIRFAEAGADYLIGGMGVGSICQTGSSETGRGNGRGQMTVARELARARDDYNREKGKYVNLVLDGGLETNHVRTVALAFADLIMMGNYFNRFFEAAGRKLDADNKPTSEEALMKWVETWGEGHPKARLVSMYGIDFRRKLSDDNADPERVIERYGHSTLAGSTIEGVAGKVPYRGRLKPWVERDARYIRTTISNAGAHDLESFREKAILEKASRATSKDMLPHDIEVNDME